MKICTEADYLQAHLTTIPGRVPPAPPPFEIALRRAVSRLKNWIFGEAAPQAWHSSQTSRRARASSPARKEKH